PVGERVVGEQRAQIGGLDEREHLEAELRRIRVGGELARVDGEAEVVVEVAVPVAHPRAYGVGGRAGLGVEVGGDGGEEAAAREHAFLGVVEGGAQQGGHAGEAARAASGGFDDALAVDVGGRVDRGELEL